MGCAQYVARVHKFSSRLPAESFWSVKNKEMKTFVFAQSGWNYFFRTRVI